MVRQWHQVRRCMRAHIEKDEETSSGIYRRLEDICDLSDIFQRAVQPACGPQRGVTLAAVH